MHACVRVHQKRPETKRTSEIPGQFIECENRGLTRPDGLVLGTHSLYFRDGAGAREFHTGTFK
jgi:hypothetical protein